MSDAPLRLSSLTVLGGPLHGKSVTLAEDEAEVLIGSGPDCRFQLDIPGVAPAHARIRVDPGAITVEDTGSPRGVFVNFERVAGEAPLGEGDMLRLGPANEPGCVMIRLQFEPWPAASRAHAAPHAAPPPEAPAALTEDDTALIQELSGLEGADEAAPARAPSPVAFIEDQPLAVGDEQPLAAEPVLAAEPLADEAYVVVDEAAADEFAIAPEPLQAAAVSAPGGEADEAFFIADEGPPGPVPPPSPPEPLPAAGDDAFFFDAQASLPAVPPPTPERVPAAAPASDDGFFISEAPLPAPSAADFGDLSFATDDVVLDEPGVHAAAARVVPGPAAAPAPPAAAGAKPPAADKPASVPVTAEGTGRPAARSAPTAPEPSPAVRPRRAPDEGAAPRRADGGARRPERSAAARRPAASGPPLARYGAIGGAVLAVLLAGGYLARRGRAGAQIDGLDPSRARVGQTVAVSGKGFASEAGGNVVLFGDREGQIVDVAEGRIQVRVPEIPVATGQEARVPVRVRVGGRDSPSLDLVVFGGPILHGISPDVGLPGEEVELAGDGWGIGATVRFGSMPAEVLQSTPSSIRVRVPALPGGPGTSAPVVVSAGGAESNPAPFQVGRLPLVTKVEPAAAGPGDALTIGGRGFKRQARDNDVRIGGARALVASAFDNELKVVVPFEAASGPQPVEVRVAGFENVGQGSLTVAAAAESVDFKFVAEPFDPSSGRDHAVLATGLGPAFVLAASSGRTAAERALETERRLNDAAALLKASRDLAIEVRNLDSNPVLALVGRPDGLLDVTEDDATAYNEDWTGLKGRGGPVTRARLGAWWGAVARDLVAMLVRGEKPQYAAALAPEGRVLGDVFQAAQKTGRFGVPRSVVAEARPALRDALRLLAFRVPPSVTGPAAGAGAAPGASAAAAAGPPLKLEGTWAGSEVEGGLRRYVTVTFRGTTGTLGYEGTVTVSVPLLTLEQPQKGTARFSVQYRGGLRYYNGKWDGVALSGTVSSDPAGKEGLATFELKPR